MSDVTTCRTCGLPRFNGPAGYAGAQCLCQWKGATLPKMHDELMAKNAALEAENARLLAANLDCVAHFEQMRAQLAAIQGGVGEEVEVVAWTWEGSIERLRQGWCPDGVAVWPVKSPGCPIGLMTVAQHQRITAAMAAEVERHRAANRDLQQMHAADRYEIERLRAELAEVKGREAACFVVGKLEKTAVIAPPLPVGTKLYTTTPASPDVEGLVNELQRIAEKCSDPDTTDALDTALSTWRQAQEGKP